MITKSNRSIYHPLSFLTGSLSASLRISHHHFHPVSKFRLRKGFWRQLANTFAYWCVAMATPAEVEAPVGGAMKARDVPKVEDKVGCGRGLSLKWDNIPTIRQRMRSGFNLLVHFDAKLKKTTNEDVEKSSHDLRANTSVLEPVCKLISTLGLPGIEDLEYEVKQLFSMYSVLASEKTISKQAWAIRGLIQVLKGSVRAHADEPTRIKRCPKDCQMFLNFPKFLTFSFNSVVVRGFCPSHHPQVPPRNRGLAGSNDAKASY